MAKANEEEVDYVSDPEEEKRLLGMRRRKAASDDEEDEEEEKPRLDRRAPIHSDESDGQGGAAEYEDDDEDELYGEEEYEEEVYEDDEEAYDDGLENADGFGQGKVGTDERIGSGGGGEIGRVEVSEKKLEGKMPEEGVGGNAVGIREEEEEGEDGKKENEPFAVPTAGAFYMHDDRFRDNAGGRNRRVYGGRKLWETKDDKKWGHDKFEEMSMQERHYEQGRRTSRSHYRARGGKNRGPDHGYTRRNRSKPFNNGDNQNQAPKGMRGRGPRKYESAFKNSGQTPPTQNKQRGKPLEKASHGSLRSVPAPVSHTEPDQGPPARKHSSLSSASPPFYPSGSSSKDIVSSQKRDVHAGSTSRNIHSPAMDESYSMQQANALLQGKNVADTVGINKLYFNDIVNPSAGKPLKNVQMIPGSSLVNAMHSTQSRVQGRGVASSGQMTYQASSSHNQFNRISPAVQLHSVQQSPQGCHQPSIQSPGQQFGQRSHSQSQASSPSKTSLSINSYEPGEVEINSESDKSGEALVGKGKSTIQGSRSGSFLYSGAQVMGATGNMGVGHGDQNFPAPAFLPVMQFGGQHPGGIGVPAVGMAFPGYVAQPQHGLENSEMTWLPVLTGAAGALGATYGPPYIAVDGAYHTRPSGQTSYLGTISKDSNKTDDERKPSHKPEVMVDEFGHRQKPRRYSEMDFKQPSTST